MKKPVLVLMCTALFALFVVSANAQTEADDQSNVEEFTNNQVGAEQSLEMNNDAAINDDHSDLNDDHSDLNDDHSDLNDDHSDLNDDHSDLNDDHFDFNDSPSILLDDDSSGL